jgi:hypothetical protein
VFSGGGACAEPTHDDLRAVAAFNQVFEHPDFVPGRWREDLTPEGYARMGDWEPSDHVRMWAQALEEHNVLLPFDWTSPRWSRQMRRYREEPGALAHADLRSVRKVLTTIHRAERFSEGFTEAMFDAGVVQAALHRLHQLSLPAR